MNFLRSKVNHTSAHLHAVQDGCRCWNSTFVAIGHKLAIRPQALPFVILDEVRSETFLKSKITGAENSVRYIRYKRSMHDIVVCHYALALKGMLLRAIWEQLEDNRLLSGDVL